jgi:hypothetical protein
MINAKFLSTYDTTRDYAQYEVEYPEHREIDAEKWKGMFSEILKSE